MNTIDNKTLFLQIFFIGNMSDLKVLILMSSANFESYNKQNIFTSFLKFRIRVWCQKFRDFQTKLC